MKKIIIFTCFCFFIFVNLCSSLSADTQRGFNVGVSTGTFPFVWEPSVGACRMNSLRFGAQIGYQFTKRLGITGEFAYAYSTSSWKTTRPSLGMETSAKTTYSTIPINASVFFTTPVGENFSVCIGLGLGYYTIKYKKFYNQTNGTVESWTESDKINELAPTFNLGFDCDVSKRLAIFFEVREIVGKTKFKSTRPDIYDVEQDLNFGGTEFKIGIKFYFGEKSPQDARGNK